MAGGTVRSGAAGQGDTDTDREPTEDAPSSSSRASTRAQLPAPADSSPVRPLRDIFLVLGFCISVKNRKRRGGGRAEAVGPGVRSLGDVKAGADEGAEDTPAYSFTTDFRDGGLPGGSAGAGLPNTATRPRPPASRRVGVSNPRSIEVLNGVFNGIADEFRRGSLVARSKPIREAIDRPFAGRKTADAQSSPAPFLAAFGEDIQRGTKDASVGARKRRAGV